MMCTLQEIIAEYEREKRVREGRRLLMMGLASIKEEPKEENDTSFTEKEISQMDTNHSDLKEAEEGVIVMERIKGRRSQPKAKDHKHGKTAFHHEPVPTKDNNQRAEETKLVHEQFQRGSDELQIDKTQQDRLQTELTSVYRKHKSLDRLDKKVDLPEEKRSSDLATLDARGCVEEIKTINRITKRSDSHQNLKNPEEFSLFKKDENEIKKSKEKLFRVKQFSDKLRLMKVPSKELYLQELVRAEKDQPGDRCRLVTIKGISDVDLFDRQQSKQPNESGSGSKIHGLKNLLQLRQRRKDPKAQSKSKKPSHIEEEAPPHKLISAPTLMRPKKASSLQFPFEQHI